MVAKNPRGWPQEKHPLVQILVVVANIQVKSLRTEVEKGFLRTAIDQEWIGPNAQINFEN